MLFAASVEESGSNEIHPRNVHTTDVDRLDHYAMNRVVLMQPCGKHEGICYRIHFRCR